MPKPTKIGLPANSSPAIAVITVMPEMSTARPDVPAAISTASSTEWPRSRSSIIRRVVEHRVVHADGKTDDHHELGHVDRERVELADRPEQADRARHGGGAEHERETGGDERAERDQQDDQQQRVGDELRPLAVLRVLGRDLLRGRGVAELLDAHARMGASGRPPPRRAACRRASRRARPSRRISKFTTTERPSSETVFARAAGSSGLSISVTPSIRSRRLTTSRTAAVTSGSPASTDPLPCTSTCSPARSGKPAALTIMSPRLDSPLPRAESSRSFWPTLPPRTAARTTNSDPAEDGRLAVLGAPSTGTRCEVAGLHGRLLRRVRTLYDATYSYAVRSRKGGKPNHR